MIPARAELPVPFHHKHRSIMGNEVIMAMEPAEIGNYGERHVTAILKKSGWSCYHNTQQPGSTDIKATRQKYGSDKKPVVDNDGKPVVEGVLVQVKTGMHPNEAPTISPVERQKIVTRASAIGYVAWLARAQINEQGQLVGKLVWTKLT